MWAVAAIFVQTLQLQRLAPSSPASWTSNRTAPQWQPPVWVWVWVVASVVSIPVSFRAPLAPRPQ
jgi:hypothetical protein